MIRISLMSYLEWRTHPLYPGPIDEPVEKRPKTYSDQWRWNGGSPDDAPGWEWNPDETSHAETPQDPSGLWLRVLRLLK